LEKNIRVRGIIFGWTITLRWKEVTLFFLPFPLLHHGKHNHSHKQHNQWQWSDLQLTGRRRTKLTGYSNTHHFTHHMCAQMYTQNEIMAQIELM